MNESDLYLPAKAFLTAQGYEVKGEVHDCDVLAVRGEETPVVVELKLRLNLEVVLQAVDRLSLTPLVYIGIPARCKSMARSPKRITKMLRMLGLGLLVIDPGPSSGGGSGDPRSRQLSAACFQGPPGASTGRAPETCGGSQPGWHANQKRHHHCLPTTCARHRPIPLGKRADQGLAHLPRAGRSQRTPARLQGRLRMVRAGHDRGVHTLSPW